MLRKIPTDRFCAAIQGLAADGELDLLIVHHSEDHVVYLLGVVSIRSAIPASVSEKVTFARN
jgi:hypothetical protein